MKRRIITAALIVCLLAALFVPAAAVDFSDMPSDYSTEALKAAVDNGLLNGWDGKIFPEDPLTRAQMAAIVVRAFGAAQAASLAGYADVSEGDWFCLDMARAVHMKVIQGDGKRLMPNDPVTRQQAFTILARALRLEEGTRADLAAFSDADEVADWAVGPVAAMVKAGYIHGSDGRLMPNSSIRRKDFAVMMHNIFKKYVRETSVVTAVPEGSVLVSAPGVTFRNVTIRGDLVLGDGVGSGDVVLDNVVVLGRLVVRGGGANSVIIRGSSSVGTVVVTKVDGKVRVLVEDGADVAVIHVEDGRDDVIIEGNVEKVVVQAGGVPVVLKGSANEVTVHGAEAAVTVEGSVGTLTTTETAQSVVIRVAEGGSIETVHASGRGTQVSGGGTVKEVSAAGDNVSVNTPGTRVTAAPGTSGVTAGGKPVTPGQTVTVEEGGASGGGGAGGGGGGGGGGTGPAPKAEAELSWARVSSENETISDSLFSKDPLVIDDAVEGVPVYLAIRVKNISGVPYDDAYCVIQVENVNERTFDVEIVTFTDGENVGTVEFKDGFTFALSRFTPSQVRVVIVKLTPQKAGTYTINVFAAQGE